MNRIVISLSFAALILSMAACKNEAPATREEDPIKVRTITTEEKSFSIPVKATGTLASETQSNLSFMTGGIIKDVRVDEGQEVKKGELLAELDMTEINSRLQQSRLGLEKANRDYSRVENLYQDSVVTLEQYQDARTALKLAETNYEIASFNKKHSQIVAPANGKILKKLMGVNEIVAPGHPLFAFASTDSEWVLRVSLSDRDIVSLNRGDKSEVTFDAYPGQSFEGIVDEIANAASLMSGTYEVEIRLKEKPEKLVSGLVGKAMIYPEEKSYLVLPPDAIFEAKGLNAFVFKLENDRVNRIPVQILSITDRGIIISNGISPGDRVVTDGNSYLNDGEKVTVVD